MSSGYDLSASTFSPDGRVFQVEYAAKAVEKSGYNWYMFQYVLLEWRPIVRTAIGIKCVDGVVLGVENPVLSKMLVPGGNRRIFTVDEHAGVAMAGFAADARKLVEVARAESSSYRDFYGSPIPGHTLNMKLA
jgi:20S proteasome subunit alpha 7